MNVKKKVAVFMGVMTVGAFSIGAATGIRVAATYKQQQINYNNNVYSKPVIEYDGKNYVSIRDVSEILGVNIEYDKGVIYMDGAGSTNTSNASNHGNNGNKGNTTMRYSKAQPAPIGVSQSVLLNAGSTSYKGEICVKQIIRGAEAGKKIKAADKGNLTPREDQEYILAQIAVKSADIPAGKSVKLSEEVFGLYSETDMEYGPITVVAPTPRFNGTLKSGSILEGWACFLVDKTDANPKIGYQVSDEGAAQAWFRLS